MANNQSGIKTFSEFIQETEELNEQPSNVAGAPVSTNDPNIGPKKKRSSKNDWEDYWREAARRMK